MDISQQYDIVRHMLMTVHTEIDCGCCWSSHAFDGYFVHCHFCEMHKGVGVDVCKLALVSC